MLKCDACGEENKELNIVKQQDNAILWHCSNCGVLDLIKVVHVVKGVIDKK